MEFDKRKKDDHGPECEGVGSPQGLGSPSLANYGSDQVKVNPQCFSRGQDCSSKLSENYTFSWKETHLYLRCSTHWNGIWSLPRKTWSPRPTYFSWQWLVLNWNGYVLNLGQWGISTSFVTLSLYWLLQHSRSIAHNVKVDMNHC